MPINESLKMEIREESKATRKILERVPDISLTWKPHEKSMPLSRLASHVAELPGWVAATLDYDEMDFAKFEYKPPVINSNSDLIKILDESLDKAFNSLEEAQDEDFMKTWSMRKGETIYFTLPKIFVIRSFAMNHMYHHRGQLTVFLRLLNVPLPNTYGPSADEPM
jgi:uncharacterized damage-inducible protein DinB